MHQRVASSYEEEVRRDLDFTMQRLSNPRAVQFVALASNAPAKGPAYREAEICALRTRDWIGSLVLMGPQAEPTGISARSDPFQTTANDTKAESQASARSADKQLHSHLNGMFVVPFVRRSGVGVALVRAALERAEFEGASLDCGVCCTIIVDEWNESANKLYERSGFQVVARELYGEDRVALRVQRRRQELDGRQ